MHLCHGDPDAADAKATVDSGEIVLGAGAVCCLEEQLLELPFTATFRTLSMVHLVFFDLRAMVQLAARHAGARRGLWWMIALAALHDEPAFASLPKNGVDALRRDATFVEVADPHDDDAPKPRRRFRDSIAPPPKSPAPDRDAGARSGSFEGRRPARTGWGRMSMMPAAGVS